MIGVCSLPPSLSQIIASLLVFPHGGGRSSNLSSSSSFGRSFFCSPAYLHSTPSFGLRRGAIFPVFDRDFVVPRTQRIFFPKEAEGRKEGIILTSTKMSTIIFKESSFPPFIGHSNLICPFPSLPFFQWNENIKKIPFSDNTLFPLSDGGGNGEDHQSRKSHIHSDCEGGTDRRPQSRRRL